VVQYDEIVRIEPGKEASVYGDVSFFDYVAVEGSDDGGLTWQTLGPGYDSRFAGFEGDGSALMAPPAQTDATEHRISLAGVFEPGDEIIVRFRLFSDNALTGWGWAIDNLKIYEPLPTGTEHPPPLAFVLEPSYPNPFRAATRIDYSLPASTPVELAIYDVNGRVVRTLVSVERQPAGVYQVEWDGRNQAGLPVASGMYFYRLQAGDRLVDSRMMVRIR
jgi:hypothetical protein